MTMMFNVPISNKRKPFKQVYDRFTMGVNTLLEEARIGDKMAKEATNLMQKQDGIWSTKWGSGYYGQALPNGKTPDGSFEYVKSDETTELIAVAGTVYKSTDGGTWSAVSGATFTAGNTCYFLQIGSRLYITNGVDSLAYYNGSTLSTYSALAAPAWGATPLTLGAGLNTGSYTAYYQVIALNDVGFTEGSTEQSITHDTLRDSWVATDNEYITLDWAAVSGASRYEVYYSDESGYEVYLGSTTDTTFRDDNSLTPNPYREVPDDNTTTAPKFKQMELSGNRMWATNDPDNKYRVYGSGTGQFMGYFSEFYGGFYIDLEKGGRDMPKAVSHYRTGKGDSIITVLCSSPEGKGSTWQISLESTTVGETTFTVPSAYKIIGSIGTNAPLSVVKSGNNIYFFNKKGFTTLGSKPNLLNILSSDEISVNIRPNVRNLVGTQIENVCGYAYEGKIFWSVPESSSGNDRIYIFDTERGNWQIAWTTGVKQFVEYTDSSKNTHLLGVPLTGSKLIEFSENISGDLGAAFNQKYISGLYPMDKDRTVWAKIKYAWVELGRPKGTISVSLLGTEKKKGFSTVGSATISDTVSTTGYSFSKYTSVKYSDTDGTPTVFSSSSVKKRIRVNKLLNNYQMQVSSSGLNDYWSLLSWQVDGWIVPTQPPASQRN